MKLICNWSVHLQIKKMSSIAELRLTQLDQSTCMKNLISLLSQKTANLVTDIIDFTPLKRG